MGGGQILLLSICITHFLTINGDEQITHIPRSPPPKTQDCTPPLPCPPLSSRAAPRKSPSQPLPHFYFESERLALVYPAIQAFKKNIANDPLGSTKTWRGTDICRYNGFICGIVPDYKQKAVMGVKFNNHNFSGSPNLDISELLLGLPDIVFFLANSNKFTGNIPESIGGLRYLNQLDLSNNHFTGAFPYQVLNAKKLVSLDLRFNIFEGLVPPQVFLLNLNSLFINNNHFIQKLPDNLGATPALYLTLANNKFIGPIPKSIGQASNTLLEVLFLNNQLSGCLPYEIGLLKKATVFDVGFNHLTGPIPHSFQCLKKMKFLNLGRNQFYGPVPEAVCSLPKLSNFTLSYNYFTQVGPRCRKMIKDGVLDVKMNCILDLPNQRSAAECARFFPTIHSCMNESSLIYVPCSVGIEELESLDIERNAPAPAQAPQARSYGALSANYSFFW